MNKLHTALGEAPFAEFVKIDRTLTVLRSNAASLEMTATAISYTAEGWAKAVRVERIKENVLSRRVTIRVTAELSPLGAKNFNAKLDRVAL